VWRGQSWPETDAALSSCLYVSLTWGLMAARPTAIALRTARGSELCGFLDAARATR
jgi:hypothetical protein